MSDKQSFKVGDRVCIKNNVPVGYSDICNDSFSGIGVVVQAAGCSVITVGICFDDYIFGHDCMGRCTKGHGWYVRRCDLRIVNEECSLEIGSLL